MRQTDYRTERKPYCASRYRIIILKLKRNDRSSRPPDKFYSFEILSHVLTSTSINAQVRYVLIFFFYQFPMRFAALQKKISPTNEKYFRTTFIGQVDTFMKIS